MNHYFALAVFISVSTISTLVSVGASDEPHRQPPIANGLRPSVHIENMPPTLSSLKERMTYHNVPGVSVAFLQNYVVTWVHTEGVTNSKTNFPVDAQTMFQAASISKPVFATTLMRYREINNLDLDIDVNSLLKNWQLPQHQWQHTSPVTLRRLLSHTAGTNLSNFGGYRIEKKVPSLISLLEGTHKENAAPLAVLAEPGTKFRYSGGGITLAQMVLEDQAGRGLPILASEYLFKPLNMKRSSFTQPLSDEFKENVALPHDDSGILYKKGPLIVGETAAAGLWTTPTNLMLWAAEILRANNNKGQLIFGTKSAKEMLTKHNGRAGLGLFLKGDKEIIKFNHAGVTSGATAIFLAHTKTGDGVAIMTNGDNGQLLTQEILFRLDELYGWDEARPIVKQLAVVSDKNLQRFTGQYRLTVPVKVTMNITFEGGSLILNAGSILKNRVFLPEDETQFFSTDRETLSFGFDERGEVIGLTYGDRYRRLFKAEKIKPTTN